MSARQASSAHSSQGLNSQALNSQGLDDEEAWHAVLTRDACFDGKFYYAVATTGIYCLPSCAARKPKRANTAFFASCFEAENAGYRACKRCRPDEEAARPVWAERVEKACRLIEESETTMTLSDLARAVGSSAHHFHRQFKNALGITPKAYAAALQDHRVRVALSRGATVTEALYEAGFSSSGRFYSGQSAALGMAPDTFRKGGVSEDLTFATAPCSLGVVLAAASKKGLCAILLGESPDVLADDLRALFPKATLTGGDTAFAATMAAAVALVDRPGKQLELPLDIRGTAFQRRVWETLRKIPAGETQSYSELATAIGAPGAVRAVASACAANKLAVAIPCHRVIRRDGSVSGYRWGADRKRALLEKEKD
ncbi:MAG: bifunctional DNA-binding transcriptional regulator/O6-methylguanine-DNA methyltransferase Ada [Methyloceanibacter sp.]|nr:bifunctional DNA-binding transcriptional regulator/O6-methylguanine-DNA methyltransferase Ada [Methyloceanibacter sp.]